MWTAKLISIVFSLFQVNVRDHIYFDSVTCVSWAPSSLLGYVKLLIAKLSLIVFSKGWNNEKFAQTACFFRSSVFTSQVQLALFNGWKNVDLHLHLLVLVPYFASRSASFARIREFNQFSVKTRSLTWKWTLFRVSPITCTFHEY